MERSTATVDSPIGPLGLVASEVGLVCVWFDGPAPERFGAGTPGAASDRQLTAGREELAAYFAGNLREFTVPLDLSRSTPFGREVLAAVAAVPYGMTTTYSTVARSLGRPMAVRAVGRANATNPLPLVIPCHRVVGAGGSLTGYGGGLDRKRWLLAHEAGR
jgi:methylated-DNA-[protein]-cysteine S-methyltransferase